MMTPVNSCYDLPSAAMLFHGIHKLIDGVDGIRRDAGGAGLPRFIAYGVLVGKWSLPC